MLKYNPKLAVPYSPMCSDYRWIWTMVQIGKL